MKTYIWTLPTRLFHWLLAVAFGVGFLLGGEEEYLNLHAALGCFAGVLVLFRIVQGFIGPRYTRFSDFPVSFSSIKQFITNMRQSKTLYPGHNPFASVVMMSIFLMVIVSAVSGMLIFAVSDSGIFGLKINQAIDAEIVEDVHTTAVYLLLGLAGIHLAGLLVDILFHPESGTLWSIFTGFKKIEAIPASPGRFQKAYMVPWFIIPLLFFWYMLFYQPVPISENEKSEQVDESEEEDE